MSGTFDFNRYWGVRLVDVRCDCKTMSLIFDLYWTSESVPHKAHLRFEGVSSLEFSADRIFVSEVVELVSLEGVKESTGWKVVGELSNYEFTILCANIKEA